MLRAWLDQRGSGPGDPIFPTRRGQPFSRDAVALLASGAPAPPRRHAHARWQDRLKGSEGLSEISWAAVISVS